MFIFVFKILKFKNSGLEDINKLVKHFNYENIQNNHFLVLPLHGKLKP